MMLPGWRVRLWLDRPLARNASEALAPLGVQTRLLPEHMHRFRNRDLIERWRNPAGKSDFMQAAACHITSLNVDIAKAARVERQCRTMKVLMLRLAGATTGETPVSNSIINIIG